MDVSYWGPSGWQLFHLITFEKGMLESKKHLFYAMKDVLPCKYCRASANEFIKEVPIDNNLAFWLYKFHDRVNKKLEAQHEDDPNIPLPVPSPPFSEVVNLYTELLKKGPTNIPGRDFLFSVAYNFDPEYRSAHEQFWKYLVKVYPFYRTHMEMPDMTNNQTYLRSVHAMFSKMRSIPSLQSVRQQLAYYKSGCKSKTYKGKTCKKVGSGYTKRRDRHRTYKLTHSRLL